MTNGLYREEHTASDDCPPVPEGVVCFECGAEMVAAVRPDFKPVWWCTHEGCPRHAMTPADFTTIVQWAEYVAFTGQAVHHRFDNEK